MSSLTTALLCELPYVVLGWNAVSRDRKPTLSLTPAPRFNKALLDKLNVALLPRASEMPLSMTSDVPVPVIATLPVPVLADAPESSNVPAETVVPPAYVFAPDKVSLPGEILVRALVLFVPLMLPAMVASALALTSSIEVPVASVQSPLKVTGFAKLDMTIVLADLVTMGLPMLIGTVAVGAASNCWVAPQ